MITFSKDIATDRLLYAYNNNVVRFASDNAQVPDYCTITGLGFTVRLYPTPSGDFRFDFKEYAMAVVNTKRFADDLQTNLINGDASSFTYDVTDGTFIEGIVSFEIYFPDETTESVTRNLKFLAGVVQLENYKKQEILAVEDIAILSPVASRTSNTVNLKYWEGYPFEFSFYTAEPSVPFALINTTNGLNYDFEAKGKITSLWLSDGRTNVTLEDFLPLVIGANRIVTTNEDVFPIFQLNIEKVDSECGVYVKWLNHLGRWNYWLLHKNSYRDLNSKYSEEIDNDFRNLNETTSPMLQTGKVTNELIKCNSGKLTAWERDIFIGILSSPKIMLFVGERFARASVESWIEVTLKTSTLRTYDARKKTYKYNVDFELPTRYAQRL